MNDLKKILLVAVAFAGVSFFSPTARAEDDKPMTGVLIDNACGDKKADEKAAAGHTAKCAMKDSCSASGYQLIMGDKHIKLDDKGNEQAKAYFEKNEGTKVTIDGKMDGEKLAVTSIKAAPKEEKKEN